MRHICVLGSTGSIGVNTLQVVRAHPELFKIAALTAHSNVELLAQQCIEFKPELAVVGSASAAQKLQDLLRAANVRADVQYGPEALVGASTLSSVDTVMAAIVGAAGLVPTIEAAKLGKRILLANKESLVMAGDIFMAAIAQSGAELLPIDSEHNAIYQCLPDANTSNGGARGQYSTLGVKEILLTASGGPFRKHSIEQLASVTPDQACAHPNWVMGRKISVDSATMMNKGLEVIEAHYLFGLPSEQIKVLIHPQSVIHSMVQYRDASVVAQLGTPDMRVPIAYGLSWPERMNSGAQALDFHALSAMTFEALDDHGHAERFPGLRLAWEALAAPSGTTAVLNAANEIAVAAFLERRIRFDQIHALNLATLNAFLPAAPRSLEDLLAIDAQARAAAQDIISRGMR